MFLYNFFFNIFFNPNHAYWNQRRLFSGKSAGYIFVIHLIFFLLKFFEFQVFYWLFFLQDRLCAFVPEHSSNYWVTFRLELFIVDLSGGGGGGGEGGLQV